jgi:hypothetical protein
VERFRWWNREAAREIDPEVVEVRHPLIIGVNTRVSCLHVLPRRNDFRTLRLGFEVDAPTTFRDRPHGSHRVMVSLPST